MRLSPFSFEAYVIIDKFYVLVMDAGIIGKTGLWVSKS
jgi:hypothetical protein